MLNEQINSTPRSPPSLCQATFSLLNSEITVSFSGPYLSPQMQQHSTHPHP
jgi:hypothetical protein